MTSFIIYQFKNLTGTNAINIYIEVDNEQIIKPKKIRQNILSKLNLEPYYKCGVMPQNDVKDCIICINKIESNEYIRKLKCNHLFHKKCVDNWLKKNQNCPMCRKTVENK